MTVTRSRQVSESSRSRAYQTEAARLAVAADRARRAAKRQRDRRVQEEIPGRETTTPGGAGYEDVYTFEASRRGELFNLPPSLRMNPRFCHGFVACPTLPTIVTHTDRSQLEEFYGASSVAAFAGSTSKGLPTSSKHQTSLEEASQEE